MSRPQIVTLLVACLNIPTKVGRAAWVDNFLKLVDRADIFGINEAGSLRAKLTYRKLAIQRGYGYYGLWRGPNPVFWDKRVYEFHSAAQVRLHARGTGWRARRWPGFNGARYATIVTLKPRSGGPLVTFINWHFVAPGPKIEPGWRARMRASSIAKIAAIVEHHHNAGRIVVGVGDANIKGPFEVTDGWEWVHVEGVDKTGVVAPPGSEIASSGAATFAARTDHKYGRSAAITIRKANR